MSSARYSGALAKPLKPHETVHTKIVALKAALKAESDRDAVVAMLLRHVIGKKASCGYPLALRGAPKRGTKPVDRIPDLFAHLGVASEQEALLEMARRHVPGFSAGRKGGRPSDRASGRYNISTEADVAQIWEAIEDRLGQTGLTVQQCAERISTTERFGDVVNPFFGFSAKKIVEAFNHRKRGDRLFATEMEEVLAELGSSLSKSKLSGKP
jgi:hypothetical protein